jgi:steroid delta-isomerase-like uncharacterized protein
VSSEQNKVNMSRLMVDLFAKGDISVADELVMPDFIEHSAAPGLPAGIAGLKAIAQIIRAGFPDFEVLVDDAVAEGDRVALRLTERGTHKGVMFGVPPSGRYASWSAMHLIRVKDGKMAEHWDVVDLLSMMQQIGGIPAQSAH